MRSQERRGRKQIDLLIGSCFRPSLPCTWERERGKGYIEEEEEEDASMDRHAD